jgi:putative Mg2+ transporter-C (MgtC) family protein
MSFVKLGSLVVGSSGDATRVLGQVVTGVGFIGAGVMLAREGLVRGVTSAAVIWMLARIGSLVGFGRYGAALAMTFVVLLVLSGVQVLEKGVRHLRRGDYAKEVQDDHLDQG